jgi:predicted ABC-type ATPase
MSEKKIVIIAGPNGAGKTTFAREFLPNEAGCPIFINADLIAAGLSPFKPELAAVKAGRLMLKEIHEYFQHDVSFAFETTLAGRTYARMIPVWQAAGYHVKLFFLALPSAEMAIARVAERVRQGGHNVPDEVIRRRYAAGRNNFDLLYCNLVDSWALYNNAGDEPQLIDWSQYNEPAGD